MKSRRALDRQPGTFEVYIKLPWWKSGNVSARCLPDIEAASNHAAFLKALKLWPGLHSSRFRIERKENVA